MKELLSMIQVCSLLNLSNSTVIRIRMDSDMNFPKPVKGIGKSKIYFLKHEIEE
jgi:predicted DNA-binding transcriptional regulator AlpA